MLDHHWPTVPKWDDVTTLTGRYILDHTDGVDLVAWGSPCQDLSVAGRRAGLAGERSGLFHQGIRIITELRELSNGKYPRWSVWENVVGALSSNGGADFGEVLHEMDEAGACFSEWAVLDAQYFGVPHRRRRVFVISCFDHSTADRCGDKILAVEQGSRRSVEKSDPARENLADGVANCLRVGSGVGERGDGTGNLIVIDRAMFNQGENALYEPFAGEADTMPSLVAKGPHAVAHNSQVRRLTPVECERLMEWPDNHTAIGTNGSIADTSRYKMCGNGVVSPVAQWIAGQINTQEGNKT